MSRADIVAFVDYAERLWSRGRVLMDPEQAFIETAFEADEAVLRALPAAFAERGIPYRDYAVDGMAWSRAAEKAR